MARVCRKVVVKGMVQGVLFRASLSEIARELRVEGWVRNRHDGSVEAMLEGEEENVRQVISWARRGPRRARVDEVTVHEIEELKGFRGFRIVG